VIKAIRDQNSRFLKPSGRRSPNPGWVELTENEVYEKVSHALRCTRDPKDTVLYHAKSTRPAADSRQHFARQASNQEPASAATITQLVEDDFRRVAARQRAIFRDLIAKRRQLVTDDGDEACFHDGLGADAINGTGAFHDSLEDASAASDVEFHDDVNHQEPYGFELVFPSTHAQL
jgi:hypothetical protein